MGGENLAKKNINSPSALKLRPLISYALSSKTMANQQDLFSSFMPLILPICKDKAGNFFNEKELKTQLYSLYGLDVNIHVIKNFVGKMVSAGVLEDVEKIGDEVLYKYTDYKVSQEIEDNYNETEKELDDIFEAFHNFIDNMDNLTVKGKTKEELEDALIQWVLISNKSFSFSGDYSDIPKKEEHYVVAKFIKFLNDTNSPILQKLALLYSGAIISEFVLDKQMPSKVKKAKGFTVFLDAPFVMHLLKLSGNDFYEASLAIFNQLVKIECSICILNHSVDEIRRSIFAVLNNPKPTGPLAEAIYKKEVSEDYARAVYSNIEDAITSKTDVKILNPDSYGSRNKCYFTETMEEEFYDALVEWQNIEGRKSDVQSLSSVIRLRAGHKDRDILKSKYIFLTYNEKLAFKTKRFCLQKDIIPDSYALPIISVRMMSGLLFLLLGNNSQEQVFISGKQLLSNCSRVAMITPSLISEFNIKIKELSSQDPDQIEYILSQPPSLQIFLDVTSGNPNALDYGNIEGVIQKVKHEIAKDVKHEVTEKYEIKLHSEKEKRKKETVEKEKYLSELEALKSRNISSLNQILSRSVKISQYLSFSIWGASILCSVFLVLKDIQNITNLDIFSYLWIVSSVVVNVLPVIFRKQANKLFIPFVFELHIRLSNMEDISNDYVMDYDKHTIKEKSELLL